MNKHELKDTTASLC